MKLVNRFYWVLVDSRLCQFVMDDGNLTDEILEAKQYESYNSAVTTLRETFDKPHDYEVWEIQETAVLVKKGPFPDLKTDFIDMVNKRNGNK